MRRLRAQWEKLVMSALEIGSFWLWQGWKDAAGYEVQTILALSTFQGALADADAPLHF